MLGDFTPLHPRILEIKQGNPCQSMFSESSFLLEDAAVVPMHEKKIPDFLERWGSKLDLNGPFAVRATKMGLGIPNLSKRKMEELVGRHFFEMGNSVDLVNPKTTIRAIIAGAPDKPQHLDSMVAEPMLVIGVERNPRKPYMDKAMTSMPFFRPVTLDPKLASLLISLSHHDGKAPEQIIDPFCGTGCISMQARLRGIPTLSSDLDITMVNGAKENFAYVFDDDCIDYPFVAMDASRISAHWGRRSNTAFIFDPPYARNSRTSGEAYQVFESACKAAMEIDPCGSLVTILPSSDLEVLNDLEISNDAEVLGRSWGDVNRMLADLGWMADIAIPTRVHASLVRIVVRARGIGNQN